MNSAPDGLYLPSPFTGAKTYIRVDFIVAPSRRGPWRRHFQRSESLHRPPPRIAAISP